jgi:predicted ester cyclase
MTVAENKAVVQRFYDEFVHGGKLEVADEIISPDCVFFMAQTPVATGPEGFRQAREMFLRGFPDLHFTVEELICEGDAVVERLTVTGTHRGEFMGVAPTNRQVRWSALSLMRIRDGKIVEDRGMPDLFGLMQQLGAIPAPAAG